MTILSATKRGNVGTMLQTLETMSQQYCDAVLHQKSSLRIVPCDITFNPLSPNSSFSLSRNKHGTKKYIWNRPVEEAKKMKCYNRLKYEQFVQISGLCGPRFLSYLAKHFTHLCRALYGKAILVDRNCPLSTNMAAGNQQKHLEFTFSIKALPFHSRASIRAHKHIF